MYLGFMIPLAVGGYVVFAVAIPGAILLAWVLLRVEASEFHDDEEPGGEPGGPPATEAATEAAGQAAGAVGGDAAGAAGGEAAAGAVGGEEAGGLPPVWRPERPPT